MTPGLPTALRLYKWLSFAFPALYIPLVVYDDFVFIEKIASFSELGIFLGSELVYLLSWFFTLTLFYWIPAGVLIAGLTLGAKRRY